MSEPVAADPVPEGGHHRRRVLFVVSPTLGGVTVMGTGTVATWWTLPSATNAPAPTPLPTVAALVTAPSTATLGMPGGESGAPGTGVGGGSGILLSATPLPATSLGAEAEASGWPGGSGDTSGFDVSLATSAPPRDMGLQGQLQSRWSQT